MPPSDVVPLRELVSLAERIAGEPGGVDALHLLVELAEAEDGGLEWFVHTRLRTFLCSWRNPVGEADAATEEPTGPALLVDFAAARSHFGRRVEQRAARNRAWTKAREDFRDAALEARAARERERWLADLATWPAAFRRRLEPVVLEATTAEALADMSPDVERWARRRQGNDPHRYFVCAERHLRDALTSLREAAAAWGQARRDPHTPSARRASLRADLEAWKTNVLESLWTHGRRTVDRAELEPLARELLQEQRKSLRRAIARERRTLRDTEEKLRRNRVEKGPRKGLPLSESWRRGLTTRANVARDRLARARSNLRATFGEPDPMRAAGFYVRSRR